MNRTLQIIADILSAPSEAFRALKAEPNWLMLFVIIGVVSIGVAWAILPFSYQVGHAEILESGIDASQLERSREIMKVLSFVGIFFTPLPLLGKWLIFAGLLYFGARLLTDRETLKFKPIFATVAYSELIWVFAGLVNAALLLSFKEIDAVKDATDLHMIPSLHLIIGDRDIGTPYFTLLSHINPFTIWYLIVLSRGIAVVADLSKRRAEYLVVLLWLAVIGFEMAITALF